MKKQEPRPADNHLDEQGMKEGEDHKIELIQCESVPATQEKEQANPEDAKDSKTMKKILDPSKLFKKLMM